MDSGLVVLAKSHDDFRRKDYTCVTDRNREQLLRMIYAEGYSCHRAARLLKIAYNNAKVILTVFRREGRVKQIPIRLKRFVADFKADPTNANSTLDADTFKEMRKIFFPKLDFNAEGCTGAAREKLPRVSTPQKAEEALLPVLRPKMTLTLNTMLRSIDQKNCSSCSQCYLSKKMEINGLDQRQLMNSMET